MNNVCADCGGSCCSFRTMNISYLRMEAPIDEFLDEQDFSNLVMEDGSVPDMDWYVRDDEVLVFECNHLEDGRCTVYENRPGMCRSYECDALKDEMELDELLEESAPIEDPELVEVTDKVKEAIKNDD